MRFRLIFFAMLAAAFVQLAPVYGQGMTIVNGNSQPGAAPVWVNGVTYSAANTASATQTVSLALTVGNTVIASFGNSGSAFSTFCTDNLSTPTVYTTVRATTDAAHNPSLTTCVGIPTVSGVATITFHASGTSTPSDWRCRVDQYSGLATVQPLDAVVQNVQTWTTAANNVTSTNQATQNNGDLIYSVVYDEKVASTFSAGTGFTEREGATAIGIGAEDSALAGAGTTAGSFTAGTASTGIIHLLALSPITSNGGNSDPLVYIDFENSTDGTTATDAILTAGTHQTAAWTGTWRGTNPVTGLAVSVSAQMNLLNPVTVLNGSTYTDSGSTRGMQWASTTLTGYGSYFLNTMGQQFTACFKYLTTVPTTDTGFYSLFEITDENAADHVSVMVHSGILYMEASVNPNGAPSSCTGCTGNGFAYATGTTYTICNQYYGGAGHVHSMAVYNSAGAQVMMMTKANAGSNYLPNTFNIGRIGDTGTSGFTNIDNVILYLDPGSFPPAVIH